MSVTRSATSGHLKAALLAAICAIAEYEGSLAGICPQAERLRFSVIRKDEDLFARPWEPCVP